LRRLRPSDSLGGHHTRLSAGRTCPLPLRGAGQPRARRKWASLPCGSIRP
jgi:hypothetical protein